MRPTNTLRGAKAQRVIHRAVNEIYEPVRATFGPQGKNGLLYRTQNRGQRITNDGKTVADCIIPRDEATRIVAEVFKEACKKTDEKVGDGTTCTTILAGKLYNELFRKVDDSQGALGGQKSQAMTTKKEVYNSAENIKKEIRKVAKKIKTKADLEKIGYISTEDEEIGKLVAEMAWEVGKDGYIDVVEGYKGEIETEIIKGFRFPAKVPNKAFVTDQNKFELVAEDVPIIVTDIKLDSLREFVQGINSILEKNPKVVIVAPEFSHLILMEIARGIQKNYFIYPVKAPSLRTPQFEDLAIYTGATFISKDKGKKFANIKEEDLGQIEKIIVKDSELKEDAVITGGAGAKKVNMEVVDGVEVEIIQTEVEKRVEVLKKQLLETKQTIFKKMLERRIASMASAVGVIRVGGATETEAYYKKLKIEDGAFACRSALRGGYVKGGGLCLKEISDKLPEDDILKQIILAPYEQIQNSVEGGIEIGEDVIDPADAIYYAVEHAVQVAGNLLTCDSITYEIEDRFNGEGEQMIANALLKLVATHKIERGQIKENEEEMWLDNLGGLNDYEYEQLHRD